MVQDVLATRQFATIVGSVAPAEDEWHRARRRRSTGVRVDARLVYTCSGRLAFSATPPLVPSRHPKAKHARDVRSFTDMPNVGPATAADFALLGFTAPNELIGQDPYALYERLCALTATRQDPCVADVFIAAVRFMEGAPPHAWWHYTAERKRVFDLRS